MRFDPVGGRLHQPTGGYSAAQVEGQANGCQLLVGNWKLVSWQVVTGGEAKDLFGPYPKGYLILTREGRAMALTTAQDRVPAESEPGRAASTNRCWRIRANIVSKVMSS